MITMFSHFVMFLQVHHLGLSRPYRCFFCKDSFSTEAELHSHVTTHKKQYVCPVCHEAFLVEYLLDRHLETKHSGSDMCLADMTACDVDQRSSGEAQSGMRLSDSSPSVGVDHKAFISSSTSSYAMRLSPATSCSSKIGGPSVCCKCEVIMSMSL